MAAAILSSLCVPADLRSRLGAGGRWQLDLDRGQFFQAAEDGLDLRIHLLAGHGCGALLNIQAFCRCRSRSPGWPWPGCGRGPWGP